MYVIPVKNLGDLNPKSIKRISASHTHRLVSCYNRPLYKRESATFLQVIRIQTAFTPSYSPIDLGIEVITLQVSPFPTILKVQVHH